MRYHGVLQHLARSHVLFLLDDPSREVIAINAIGGAGPGGYENGFDWAGRSQGAPRFSPTLKGALTDRERLGGSDGECLGDGDRSLWANLDWRRRGFVR